MEQWIDDFFHALDIASRWGTAIVVPLAVWQIVMVVVR